MQKLSKSLILVLVMSFFIGFAGSAQAYNPTLSVYSSGGSSTTISIYGGQPNAAVVISYTPSGSNLSASVSGATDYNGSFTTMVNGSQISVTVGGQQVYANNNGYNGGCGYYGCSVGGMTLSQTSLNLSVGQSATVTASMPVYNPSFYISSNSNSYVASASISGSQINVYGLASGSTNISVCTSSSVCASLYVTVGSGGSSGSITFSPASVNLTAGQNSTVFITAGYYGSSLYISGNSNSSVVSASLSGSTLYLQAGNAGSSTITVCQNSTSCGYLYVTVSGVLGANTNLWFSPANPNLYVGQSMAVSINSSAYSTAYPYYSSAYNISSNSSPYVVSANISGTVLNLTANQNGSSNISVCSTALGFCGTLYVTVGGGSSYGNGSLSLSQTNLSLSQGQSMIVSAYNAPAIYVSSNSNPGVVSASVTVNQATFYAQTFGTSTVVLCGVSSNQCSSVYVTVNGYSYGGGGLQYPGSNVLGASIYQNGQLISEGSTVYIVYKNTKSGFSNSSAFLGLGFRFSNVLAVGDSGLTASGYTVTTSIGQHPWGSWIKSGQAVYFVHQSGLIPIPDWNTFLNNGGQAGFIVPANLYDFRLPMLSPMTSGDSRLQ